MYIIVVIGDWVEVGMVVVCFVDVEVYVLISGYVCGVCYDEVFVVIGIKILEIDLWWEDVSFYGLGECFLCIVEVVLCVMGVQFG